MRLGIATGLLLIALPTSVRAQPPALPPPSDAEIEQHARRLDAKNDKAARLEAIHWLNSRSFAKNAGLAIPALEGCIRQDPVMECRREAVLALALIAGKLKQPCPLAIVETFLDPEDEPRWMAMASIGSFKAFAPGAVDILLRCADADKPGLRSDALLLLARAGAKDKRALDAIERGKQD